MMTFTVLDRGFIFSLLVFFSAGLEPALPGRLYIWNVGQGQWITWVQESRCLHFDMGGEKAPFFRIRALCTRQRNELFLSHADMDHISFIRWGKKNLNGLCLHSLPREKLAVKKAKLVTPLSHCMSSEAAVKEIPTFENVKRSASLNPNDISRVYLAGSKILLPGDSTVKAEKFWSRSEAAAKAQVLILGHHGSNTSTGETLMLRLPRLKQSVVSARQRRYGHPHPKVVGRLRRYGVPALRTEVWGNISIQLQ